MYLCSSSSSKKDEESLTADSTVMKTRYHAGKR